MSSITKVSGIRASLLKTLEQASKKHPDLRLGQLLLNVIYTDLEHLSTDLYYISDRELEKKIKEFCDAR